MTTQILTSIKTAYVAIALTTLGIFAFCTAILISWPALAYLASKLVY